MQLTKINGEYDMWLPEARSARPEWKVENGGWEMERINALVALMDESDTLLYIGGETGDIAALVAKYTGCDICLFEPNKKVYPSIKAIWQANELKAPLDFFRGFVSDKSTIDKYTTRPDFFDIDVSALVPDHGFAQLYERDKETPTITIDDYCKFTGIIPTVITMDVEGSEARVIAGAEKTLRQYMPTLVISVHQVFMWEHYKDEVRTMITFLKNIGYTIRCIDYGGHEDHIIAYKNSDHE